MFDKRYITNHHKDGDTIIHGVGAPEAARLLNDLQKEAYARIDKIIFDRISADGLHMDWAGSLEAIDHGLGYRIFLYYKLNGHPHKIELPTIDGELDYSISFTDKQAFREKVFVDMATNIAAHLIEKLCPNIRTGEHKRTKGGE